jgi:hypothetical protein
MILEQNYPLPQSRSLRLLGKLVSYVFHPLFIPFYVIAYLVYIHPYAFSSLQEKQKMMKLISFFVITVFFPALTVFLLWRLKFADSIFLRTQKERIIPYVATITYFFWAWYVSKNQLENPPALIFFCLGLFICASVALMANNYFKISMHGLGVGGAMAFFILLAWATTEPMGLPVSIATTITGLVCTSRLLISDHHPAEVYWGLSVGALSQYVAWWIVM